MEEIKDISGNSVNEEYTEPFSPEDIPSASEAAPIEPEVIPSASEVRPIEPEVIPSASEVRPIEPEAIPSASEARPFEPEPSEAAASAGTVDASVRAAKDVSGQAQASARNAEEEKKKFSFKDWVPGPEFPNQLTIARICMIPLFVILLLWVPKPAGNILAMIVFIIASLTDTADGYIARKYNYVTTFGKFMDPLADKLLVCSAMICLVDLGRLESWIVIIIIAREFIISGFRLVAVEKGVVIAANIWGKVKTVIQMLMVILMVGNFSGFLGAVAQIFKWFALALTLISLASYLIQNRHVLHEEK